MKGIQLLEVRCQIKDALKEKPLLRNSGLKRIIF